MTAPTGSDAPADTFRRSDLFAGLDLSAVEHRQVVIVGSGPAGFTAALYASRAALDVLVLRGAEPGGQLTTTPDVENYPGFPEGVGGIELMEKIESQASRFGAEVRYGVVSAVDLQSRPFRLVVDEKKPITADSVIVSTGASARYLGLENERRLLGRGVSACATCDGAFFRDVELAIVGGGDTAVEEALFLTRFATKVHVIHRRGELRASKVLQQRAFAHPKIEFHWHRQVEDILGDERVDGLRLADPRTGETETLDVGGVFIAIGHRPNTSLFVDQLDLDDNGYLSTRADSTRTSREGVFACGDVQDPVYRQAITAAGTGAMAALDAERWLAEQAAPGAGTGEESRQSHPAPLALAS